MTQNVVKGPFCQDQPALYLLLRPQFEATIVLFSIKVVLHIYDFPGGHNTTRNNDLCGGCPVVSVSSNLQSGCRHCAPRCIIVWIWLDKRLR